MKKVYLEVLLLIVLLCIANLAGATVVQWTVASGGNGHWYERVGVSTNGINWDAANTQATGMGGYLVTITSAAENLFLTNEASLGDALNQNNNLHYLWTGGYQPTNSLEPSDGWAWANGESFVYNNWAAPGEPNDFNGNEDRIIFDHGLIDFNGKAWNDASASTMASGYVVEYNQAPVPEPATMFLFGLGLLGVAGVSRRKN